MIWIKYWKFKYVDIDKKKNFMKLIKIHLYITLIAPCEINRVFMIYDHMEK